MKKVLIPLTVVLIVLCGLGGVAFQRFQGGKAAAAAAAASKTAKVSRGDLIVSITDRGNVEAVRSVEVKGRVTGRIAKLLKEEGEFVTAGELLAEIDPQETRLQVEQNLAQLRGAESAVARTAMEITQARTTVQANYDQALARVRQLEIELKQQPVLSRTALEQAEAAYSSALQAHDKLIKSTLPSLKVSLASAVTEAEANMANAKREYDRNVELEQKGFTAGRNVDNARLAMELAKTRLETARDSYARFETQQQTDIARSLDSIRDAKLAVERAKANRMQDQVKAQELKSARADLEKARANLTDPMVQEQTRQQNMASVAQLRSVVGDAQRQLGETRIIAPISGVVTKKFLQEGELANGTGAFSAGSPVYRIEDRRVMRVKLEINEIDVARMRLGMEAQITVDALPKDNLKGKVTKIAPASKDAGTAAVSADNVVKYEVEITILGNNDRLRSGMSAKCTLELLRKPNVLTLPLEYVIKEADGYYIELPVTDPKKKMDPLHKPERKKITVGDQSGAKIEILGGLKEGDEVARPKFSGPERAGFMSAGPDDGGGE